MGYLIWLYLFIILAGSTLGQVEICQENCASTNRRKGPTRMRNSREHPWMIAQFPTKNNAFCQLGCQIFFAENPRNVTCKAECASQYRYRVTTRYSDVVEEAILNCQDGCDIALETCQAGFFCKGGEMLPCPAGTFRESSLGSNAAVDVCTQCQPGRYRARDKGKSPFSCAPCPVGKYASDTGSTSVVGCLRCPAGYRGEVEGMDDCIPITPLVPMMRISNRPENIEGHLFDGELYKGEYYFSPMFRIRADSTENPITKNEFSNSIKAMDIATMKSEGVFDENFIQRLFFFFILVPRFLKTEIAAPSGEMAQGEFNSKCIELDSSLLARPKVLTRLFRMLDANNDEKIQHSEIPAGHQLISSLFPDFHRESSPFIGRN